jgi:glycosyltransferase 2 family protein
VNARRAIGAVGLKLLIGGALLVWIFHTIFLLEGRQTWERLGHSWEALSLGKQWAVAWSHGPQELWQTIRQVPVGALFLSLVFMGMTILLGMIRWRMVMRAQGLNLSGRRTAEISLVAHFFNSFLLGSTGGDLFKAYYAARETRHKKTEAVMTVLIDRLLGLFSMLLFACLMMVPNFNQLVGSRALGAPALSVILMLAACAVLVGVSFWGGVSRRWPEGREWLRRLPKGDIAERALDATRGLGQLPGLFVRVVGISMVLNLFCVFQILALASGLGIELPMTVWLVIVPIIVCLSALPIAPSGLGVRENLYVMMLGATGAHVEPKAALSLSLLAFAGSLCWSVVGGFVYMGKRERERLFEIGDSGTFSGGS